MSCSSGWIRPAWSRPWVQRWRRRRWAGWMVAAAWVPTALRPQKLNSSFPS